MIEVSILFRALVPIMSHKIISSYSNAQWYIKTFHLLILFCSPSRQTIKLEMTQPEPPQTEPDSEHEAAAAEAQVALAAGAQQDELAHRVAIEAAERSSIILFNWDALRRILNRHEVALRKKWMKKSKDWRKTILSTAWPNMPLSHRPDLIHLGKAEIRFQKDGVRMESPFLEFAWPYLNMEDLTRDKPILCLLNSRGRNHPATFADSELSYCRLGIDFQVIIPLELDGFTMQLEGENVESYGKLVPIGVDNKLKAGYAPGDGLLILEIQQSLMQFLVK